MVSPEGAYLGAFGMQGNGPGQFNFPTNIARAPDGRLYVTDTMNFRVQTFDAEGRFLGTFGKLGDGAGDFDKPKGVALDSRRPHLRRRRPERRRADLRRVRPPAAGRSGDRARATASSGCPTGITIAYDVVYVADSANRRVQVFEYAEAQANDVARPLRASLVCVLALAATAAGQIAVTSPGNKHNLSVSGPGPVKSATETEICVFCHTPHNANPAVPLWNQTLSAGVDLPAYTSTTMKATVGLPTGSSKLCLACHDGTVAIGNTINNGRIAMQGVNAQGMMTGASALGTEPRRRPSDLVRPGHRRRDREPAGRAVR